MTTSNLEWTESARNRWEQFLEAKVLADGLDAEDGADLRENLTLHIEEELTGVNSGIATLNLVDQAIAGLGGDPKPTTAVSQTNSLPTISTKKKTSISSVTFGVVFPIIVFGIELVSGMCGSTFFDPLTTWFHVALVALVIGSNWWLLTARSRSSSLRKRGLISGISMAVSGFYALLFVPLIPISCFALIVFGMGLLSLTPVLNFFITWRISRQHREHKNSEWKTWWRRGLLGGFLTLILLETPSLWTRIGLQRALNEDSQIAEKGLSQLRLFHHEKTLLRACYEGNRRTSQATDISGWITHGSLMPLQIFGARSHRIDSEEVRSIYYRVTGSTFNSQAPPSFVAKGSFMRRQNTNWDELQWDDHLGEDQVAVRLANLDLIQSRMDGHIDSASGLAYQEWTMIFKNDNSIANEARMQILLPEEGVVSRVTLWVNGEPREAAFSSKSKVRKAYQAVAVRQRRDPVLVTATGPGRVLVQCFPVPANGGEMKIRIGMTSPLKKGRVATPILLERNFGVSDTLNTPVWMQAPKEFSFRGSQKSHPDGPEQSLQLQLPAANIQREGSFFVSNHSPAPAVWCEDQFANSEEKRLLRTLVPEERPALSQCLLVVDGSASMKPFAEEIQKAITELGANQNKVTIVVANDEVSLDGLKKHRFSGGRDNGPALEWALRKAREKPNSAVVWLHGPQPMGSSYQESLAQLLERGSSEVPLYSVALKPGGNRVLEKLFQYRSVQMGPRLSRGTKDLGPWLKDLVNGGSSLTAEWKRGSETEPESIAGKKVWDQLARWWATEKVRTAGRQQTADEDSIAFAAKYQLVTAFSGAVVLETAEQYKQHGLEPVDPSTTPNIPASPEPGTWFLMLMSALIALTRRKRAPC